MELLRWVRAQGELQALTFCLFTELEETVRRELGKELASRVCLFHKPSHPDEWPKVIDQMLKSHSVRI